MTDSIVHEIEEGDARFDLAFASTTKTLLHRLSNNPVIQKAQRAIAQNPYLVCTLLERAEILYKNPVEAGYLHPDDMVLAAYIFLLGSSGDHNIQEFVSHIASSPDRAFRGAIGVAKYMNAKAPRRTISPELHSYLGYSWETWNVIQKLSGDTPSIQPLISGNQRQRILAHVSVS